MTKQSNITWPKTAAAKQAELQSKLQNASSLAEVGETIQAAQAVKMPVREAIAAGLHQAKRENAAIPGKTRRRQEKKARREGGGNTAWDDVNSIAYACSRMLAVGSSIVPMLAERELLLKVTDLGLLSRLVHSITRDTRQLASDFQKIHALHKGKEGAIASDEEMMLSYSVFSDYVNFTELANSCLVPTLAHASELLGEALNELTKTNPELAARINYAAMNYEFLSAKKAMDGITGAGPSVEEEAEASAAKAEQAQVAEAAPAQLEEAAA